MNPQIETFYQTSSPWRTLDHKLAPIFSHIRNNNIHNIYQLHSNSNQQQKIKIDKIDLTLPVFHKYSRKEQNFQNQQKTKVPSVHPRSKLKRMAQTLSQYKPKQKMAMLSPHSKIKKHLVQSIDYFGIEKALHQKTDRTNRFEVFCKTIMQNKKWTNLNPQSDITRQIDKEQISPDKIEATTRNPFRVSRKHFSPATKRMERILMKSSLSSKQPN